MTSMLFLCDNSRGQGLHPGIFWNQRGTHVGGASRNCGWCLPTGHDVIYPSEVKERRRGWLWGYANYELQAPRRSVRARFQFLLPCKGDQISFSQHLDFTELVDMSNKT